jgi:hypothetical protein
MIVRVLVIVVLLQSDLLWWYLYALAMLRELVGLTGLYMLGGAAGGLLMTSILKEIKHGR